MNNDTQIPEHIMAFSLAVPPSALRGARGWVVIREQMVDVRAWETQHLRRIARLRVVDTENSEAQGVGQPLGTPLAPLRGSGIASEVLKGRHSASCGCVLERFWRTRGATRTP